MILYNSFFSKKRLNFPWKKLRDIVPFLFIYLNLHRQLFSPMGAHWFSPLIQKCIMGFIQFKWFENCNVSKWNTSRTKWIKQNMFFFRYFLNSISAYQENCMTKIYCEAEKVKRNGSKMHLKNVFIEKIESVLDKRIQPLEWTYPSDLIVFRWGWQCFCMNGASTGIKSKRYTLKIFKPKRQIELEKIREATVASYNIQ